MQTHDLSDQEVSDFIFSIAAKTAIDALTVRGIETKTLGDAEILELTKEISSEVKTVLPRVIGAVQVMKTAGVDPVNVLTASVSTAGLQAARKYIQNRERVAQVAQEVVT